MKILHCVESYYPSVSGAPEVVKQLSEHMAKLGHDVTVATRKLPERKKSKHNGVKIIEFDIKPTSNKGMSTVTGLMGEIKKYKDFLVKNKFDVIMTYAAQQWTTDLMFEVLDKVKAKTVLVPCGYSALYDSEYKRYFEKLPKYLKEFDACVYLSKDYRDINFARKNKLKNSVLIPNGADENIFGKTLSQEQKRKIRKRYGISGLMIMTLANYTGEKGHKELLYVFKRLPVPFATLVSAGGITPGVGYYDEFKKQTERVNSSKKFFGKKIVLIDGTKRKEVYRLLKAADIFIFLSNIECSPLVLYESAAAGVPFVATPAGNSSEIANWLNNGVVVKSINKANGRVEADRKDALLKITNLAYRPIKRRKTGMRGHEIWKQKYTWQKLTEKYLDLYSDLLERKT